MFRKHVTLAAALLLAASSTISTAENAIPTRGAICSTKSCCITTEGDAHATCLAHASTYKHICTTSQECITTCSAVFSDIGATAPTASPLFSQGQKPVTAPLASPGQDYTTQSVSAQELKMVNLLNNDRKNNGLAALALDEELCQIARIKSADMRDNRYFAHESPTYGKVGAMLKRFGYAFSAAGENIAHHANVDKTQAAFMSSQGHRANILNKGWTKFGIGIVQDAQGYIYATQIFAK